MKLHTVGNLVNIPSEHKLSKHTGENNIIFVGKMSYEPNIVAVMYFVNEILPAIRHEYPKLELFIVGANPDERIKKLNSVPGIKVTGFVDTIEPYFQNATIVVAPMLTGAGIQNKIIQAMSYGCCVATSSIGAEGLNISDSEIAIFDSSKAWIEGLSNLLQKKEVRKNMGAKAYRYVKENLSKEVVAKNFWEFIDDID